jgi:hypothetical protein
MVEHELLKPLQGLLALVQQLSQLAEQAEWEALEVLALDYQQQAAFLHDENYLQRLKDATLMDDAGWLFEKIYAIHSDLDMFTQLQRDKVASELRQLNQSDKALNAYGR